MSELQPGPDRPVLRHLDTHYASDGDRPGVYLIDPVGIADGTAFVPEALVPIVALFDGAHTVESIEVEIQAQLGDEQLPEGFVAGLVRQFDDALLLHSPRFDRALDEAVQGFAAAEVRPAAHAGTAGYPSDPDECARALAAMVEPHRDGSRKLRGLVAPHIDLHRGSEGYAAAYGHLAGAEPADLYVIFGTGHQGPGAAVTGLAHDWQTPLGTARTDKEFVATIHARLGPAAPLDLFLHRREHSLEFQVLFLQHVLGDRPFQVAGFLTGSLPSESAARATLVEAFRAAADGKRVCWIAGADLAHLGPHFGDEAAVDPALLERLERDERSRLAHIENGAPDAFWEAVEQRGNPDRVCGTSPMTLTAALAGGQGELLHYGQASAEDGSQVVSFCGVGFGD